MPAVESKFVFVASPSAEERANFSIVSMGHDIVRPPALCKRPQGWHLDSINYTVRGALNGWVNGKESHATAGSLWIVPRDCPFMTEVDPEAGVQECYWIEFDGAWFQPMLKMLGLTGVHHVPGCTEAGGILKEMCAQLKANGANAVHEASVALWGVFVAAEKTMKFQARHNAAAPTAIERARRFAADHFRESIGLADMAKAAGMSQFHFARLFRIQTGTSPAAYIRSLRIGHAQELLCQGEMSVKEIGHAAGFGAVQHFSTMFKQCTGMTPRQFARSYGPRRWT
jgi:AraC-like DNA-binding protein